MRLSGFSNRGDGGDGNLRAQFAAAVDAGQKKSGGYTKREVLIGLFGGGLVAVYTILGALGLKVEFTGRQMPGYEQSETDPNFKGDAVTAPGLETNIELLLERGGSGSEVGSLVEDLEALGGSQIFASDGQGRWVMPWVGGWERLWSSVPESQLLGGPARASYSLALDESNGPSLAPGGTPFSRTSTRHFVYGPGEGGITVEYLHTSPGLEGELLLTRSGRVANLGDNRFRLVFPEPLRAYKAAYNAQLGNDVLLSPSPLKGSAEQFGSLVGGGGVVLQTTYLSERMWAVRDGAGQVHLWRRTDTRSVVDRRGLVAEGQVKPPSDDSVRFGGLLFGETLQDYAGWDESIGQGERKRIDSVTEQLRGG